MSNILSLVSKIHEKGNRFIIDELKKNGENELVPSHGDILFCLYTNKKMTMKEIAHNIHRTKPTVTVLINKLEKLGYVKKESSNEDNRFTYITLTTKGKNFKSVFETISKDLNSLLSKNLSKNEYIMLEKILEKMI